MTGLVELIAAILVTGWVAERIAILILPRSAPIHWAPVAGYGAAAVAGWIGGFGFGLWMSVLAPVGALVPVLCAAWSLKRLGLIRVPGVPTPDLLVFALLGAVVLIGAAGIGPVNPYAWFYSGLGAALLPVPIALWALWRGQIAVLVGLALGQALWLADIGSSNLYDQFSHFFLPPALALLAASRFGAALLPGLRTPKA